MLAYQVKWVEHMFLFISPDMTHALADIVGTQSSVLPCFLKKIEVTIYYGHHV